MTPLVLMAVISSSVAVGASVFLIVVPPRRLATRIRPYLRGDPLVGPSARRERSVLGSGPAAVRSLVGKLADRMSDEALVSALKQARLYPDLPDSDRIDTFRTEQLWAVGRALAGGIIVVVATSLDARRAVAVLVLAAVVGATRMRGRLERAIDARRTRMRMEIATIDHVLAVRVRSGGGVVHAVQQVVARGRGDVVAELEEALRLHRTGLPAPTALRKVAESTPEPACARTYRALAAAEERGSDLAATLLALSRDARDGRREALKRSATKRRAAMLVPTIAVLAPVMLLFVAAPLPGLVLGWR